MEQLVKSGLDEVAVFVVAPFAGSSLHTDNSIALTDGSALVSFSPKGRKDYDIVARRRKSLIRTFFLEKIKNNTGLWSQGIRALVGRPQTKMENLPIRVFYIFWQWLRMKINASSTVELTKK